MDILQQSSNPIIILLSSFLALFINRIIIGALINKFGTKKFTRPIRFLVGVPFVIINFIIIYSILSWIF